ncbi:Coatomer subunit zeta-2 [Labeo rohita]|uniref:Coatomer subunit zeta n=1 Tax=Labeo rohita TaxID=84645 RepID=A0ABQ8MUI3_LABRO|nr:Coatomer subunit zeta-2 [Labeo rohita]
MDSAALSWKKWVFKVGRGCHVLDASLPERSATACMEPTLYTVKAIFILDNDGNRLLSKYYDPDLYPSMKEQKNFEKNVFNKTHKADNEIAFLEGMTIVYKSSIDLFFYVVGSAQENEEIHDFQYSYAALQLICRVILESDPQQVIEKVNYRTKYPLSCPVSVCRSKRMASSFLITSLVTWRAKERDGNYCSSPSAPPSLSPSGRERDEGKRVGRQMTTHYQNRVWHSLALTSATNSNLDSTSLKNWLSPLILPLDGVGQWKSRSRGSAYTSEPKRRCCGVIKA